MRDGFVRVAAATPTVKVADPKHNAAEIEKLICEAADKGCAVAVFPELCITAYTCGDLFRNSQLISSAEESLKVLMKNTIDKDILCVVGIPAIHEGRLYSCAAVFMQGKLLGLSVKRPIASGERYFSSLPTAAEINLCGQKTVIGEKLLYKCENISGLTVGFSEAANLVLNLSAEEETVGKADYRRAQIKVHSAENAAAYIYSGNGEGESTTDTVFAGHRLIAENGSILAESELFSTGLTIAETDLERIAQERIRANRAHSSEDSSITPVCFNFREDTIRDFTPKREFPKLPFVPADENELKERCKLILTMQASGLAARLRHTNSKTVLLGLSGGLDSTLALLVAERAFNMLKLDEKGIKAVSMPCFGTSERTKSNAVKLAGGIGAEYMEINIEKAVLQHFEDIGQDRDNFDVTFENAQARERTQVLMDLSNRLGGIVIGTGDLSELALGWATFNGDHMSMYGVNVGVPKTLIRYLVKYAAENTDGKLKEALLDVLDTPVSPELLPPKDGEISQRTEELVGPYELHDFFLYYFVRFGFSPGKIFRMAERSFKGDYDRGVIKGWLKVFCRRFISQQFKRSCMPDGVKVGSVSLSPRGGYLMPSDARAACWLDEIEKL